MGASSGVGGCCCDEGTDPCGVTSGVLGCVSGSDAASVAGVSIAGAGAVAGGPGAVVADA